MHIQRSITLRQAQDQLQENLADGSPQDCPCCGQRCQIYPRGISEAQALSMIEMYRIGGTEEWVHLPTQLKDLRSREEGKLAYWDLIEEQSTVRPDGGRAGYWRVTKKGEQFIKGQIRIPRKAFVYLGKVVGFSTEEMSIDDVLPFDLRSVLYGGLDQRVIIGL